MGIQEQKNGSWRVQVRRKGLPALDKCYPTKAEAEKAYEGVLNLGKRKEASNDSLKEMWNRYEQSSLFFSKAERTQHTERERIKPVLEVLGDYSLVHLEEDVGLIYDYIDARLKYISPKTKKSLSPTNIRLEIAALSSVARYAVQRKLIRENFVRLISRPIGKPRKRRVPVREQGGVQLAARQYGSRVEVPARFAALQRELGCRPGELSELMKDKVDLLKTEVLFIDTKNGENRMVHATSAAVDLLMAQLNFAKQNYPDSPFLFSNMSVKTKKWVKYNYLHGVKILREHGIVGSDYHSHANRREFVSRAIEAGVPLSTIKKQTGHKSVQALEIYDQGLSTAPETRAILDSLSDRVKDEQLGGMLQAIGATPEEAMEALLKITGKLSDKSEDGWKKPFKTTKRNNK